MYLCGCVCFFFFCLKLFNIFSRKIRRHLFLVCLKCAQLVIFPYGFVFSSLTFLGVFLKASRLSDWFFLGRGALQNVALWVRSSQLWVLLAFSYILKHFWKILTKIAYFTSEIFFLIFKKNVKFIHTFFTLSKKHFKWCVRLMTARVRTKWQRFLKVILSELMIIKHYNQSI